MWYIIGAIIIAILAFWYFSAKPTPVQAPGTNTAAAITSEFNQIADTSAGLDADAAASAQAVSGF